MTAEIKPPVPHQKNVHLILASRSKARQNMLHAAGIIADPLAPNLDEEALRAGLKQEGVTPRNLADALAQAKALKVAARLPDNMASVLVLGGDQVLAMADGNMLDKPQNRSEAAAHLTMLSGKAHQLYSAAVVVMGGAVIWRHVAAARMHMRPLSEAYLNAYVEAEWDNIRHCVGCYEIEGRGVQLFERIDGDHFTIMGLPMLALLQFLRLRGVLPT